MLVLILISSAQASSLSADATPFVPTRILTQLPQDIILSEYTSHTACRRYFDLLVDYNAPTCSGRASPQILQRAAFSSDAVRCVDEEATIV